MVVDSCLLSFVAADEEEEETLLPLPWAYPQLVVVAEEDLDTEDLELLANCWDHCAMSYSAN